MESFRRDGRELRVFTQGVCPEHGRWDGSFLLDRGACSVTRAEGNFLRRLSFGALVTDISAPVRPGRFEADRPKELIEAIPPTTWGVVEAVNRANAQASGLQATWAGQCREAAER